MTSCRYIITCKKIYSTRINNYANILVSQIFRCNFYIHLCHTFRFVPALSVTEISFNRVLNLIKHEFLLSAFNVLALFVTDIFILPESVCHI